MDLHVFRHGPALSKDEAGVASGRERPLSREGTDTTAASAEGVRRFADTLDAIVTSPYQRAVQSARILADAFGIAHDDVEEWDALEPDRDPMKALELLWSRHGRGGASADVAVVGHKPHLPRLVAGALTGDPEGVDVELGTASLATVRITDDGATLVRLVDPGVLRRIAGT